MMWSTTVVLSVIFSYYQVFGGEISDVTTVYEIGQGKSGTDDESFVNEEININEDYVILPAALWNTPHGTPCINGVTGHVHSRTNALGMGLIDKHDNFLDTNNMDYPNITFDSYCHSHGGCTQWDFVNGSTQSMDDPQSRRRIKPGKAYKVRDNMILSIRAMNTFRYIFFTQGPKDLKKEIIQFVLRLHGGSSEFYTDVFLDCVGKEEGGEYVGYRSGHRSEVYCRNHYRQFWLSDSNYLTFDFTQGIRIYRGMGESKVLVVDWNHGDNLDINYFSLSPIENSLDSSSTALVTKDLKLNQEGVVSPVFTPLSDDICLAILFHSSVISLSSELDILVLGSKEYLLDTIQNVQSGWNIKVVNQKLRDLSSIKLKIQKTGLADIRIARIASCNTEGEEVFELPTPISVCPYDRTSLSVNSGSSSLNVYSTVVDETVSDSVEKINDTNKQCWNGGELTSAGCACPPGFTGPRCETGCGRNRFGQDCEGLCSLRSEECRGLLMCTKFTGCQCAPGYTGSDCTQACSPGWYGNDCSQRCSLCSGNASCDIYTGECTSCEEGYLAPYCRSVSAYYGSKPEVTSPYYGTIVVSFDPNKYITVADPPQLYQIQFRKKGDQWQLYTTKPLQKLSETSEKERKISETIEGLEIGFVYQVRVLMMDDDLIKYDGDLVQVAEVLSKCDVPVFYDYKLTSSANTSSITFSWRYAIEEQNSCPLENFEVTWKEGWKWPKRHTKSKHFTLSGLRSGAVIKFKVRAITTGGSVPYSKTVITSTQQIVHPSVQNLRVGSRQSTSVEISWEPPMGSGDRQLRYIISYKCVDRPACSPGCQNVSEGQLTQEGTGITLSPLLPFTKYLVTVSAEGGSESSIYVGTTKVVPTEIPSLSAQRPVRTNTSLTVFWDQVPVCTGYQLGYNYQLTKASDALRILESGFTKETNASFHNLTASTDYVIRVFVFTVAGWNPLYYLTMNINTSATVPEAVRNLTVYKRGRGMLGLRWAEPRANYGQLKSFTVTHSLGQEVISHTVEPSHCVVWPDLYCHTIEGLRSNRRYNITVSARNVEVSEDGEPTTVTAITKESPPNAPVNLKVLNSTSTSIVLQWGHPELVNGILRSFLVSIEETEKYDQESCCQVYPLVETSVKEEYQKYDAEVSGLHPASTYFVSVSAKTVGLGPSQSLVAYTRPPHLPLTVLPRAPEVSWLPQDKLPEVNNSNIYTSLVKAHLLLAIINETQPDLKTPVSGITDPKLDSLLKQKIGKAFYFIAEYDQDDEVELSGPLEDGGSTWGRPPASLSPEVGDQLVAAQILEYSGVYNVDLRYSQPLTMV